MCYVCMMFVVYVVDVWIASVILCLCMFFFQAEDGIRDLVRSRGLGDVYKRQELQVLQREITPRVVENFLVGQVLLLQPAAQCARSLSLIHI